MLTLPLLYHELRPEPARYAYVTQCARFQAHLALFHRLAGDPTTLHPEITFDDGHLSNFRYALPLLAEHAVTARFFITVGWTAQRPGYMGWDELRALHAAGHHLGAHGWTHTLLTHLAPTALDRELRESRQTLEDRLATPITCMSLPGGRSNRRVLDACAAAGYTHIWTSTPRPESLPFAPILGRLNIRGDATDPWLEALLRPETGLLRRIQRTQRGKDLAKSLLGDHLYARVWALVNRQEPESDPEPPANS